MLRGWLGKPAKAEAARRCKQVMQGSCMDVQDASGYKTDCRYQVQIYKNIINKAISCL